MRRRQRNALERALAARASRRSLPGIEPETARQVIEAAAAAPLRGSAAPPPAGGLFDEDARAQLDMLD